MTFEIRTVRSFAAAHALKLYDGSMEPVHGHNWRLEVTVESPELDAIGVVMDFHELERMVDRIIGPWHNRHLNEVEPFAGGKVNPSAENVALMIGTVLQLAPPVRLKKVRVWETEGNSAVYRNRE